MLDLVICDAQIVDGTGGPRQGGSVGIRNGRIVAVGEVEEPSARTLTAEGRVVAPGFIDVHTHYDAQVLWDPTLSPSCLHGVTSVVGGNCGFSVAPLTEESAPYLMRMLARVEGMPLVSLETAIDWGWRSTAEYLDRIAGTIGPNVGFMIGHSAVRRAVMGPAAKERRSTADELEAMKALLREGIAAGGLGFSSSTTVSHKDGEGDPVPSRLASHQEIVELAAVCREFEGTCLELAPQVGVDPFEPSIEDLIVKMTVAAERPLNWNIIHAAARLRDVIEARLAVSDKARIAGGAIRGLLMPMPIDIRLNFTSGMVLDMLPGWDKLMALPHAEKRAWFQSTELRRKAFELATSSKMTFNRWGEYHIREAFGPETRPFVGRCVNDIAAEQRKDPFDALVDIALADDLQTTFGFPMVEEHEEDRRLTEQCLRDPRVVVGASDAGAHLDMIDTFRYTTHLLGPEVRDNGLLTTEEAVHLLTQVPAGLHGMVDRGVLEAGAFADLVVFDESTVGSGPIVTRPDLPGGCSRLYADSEGVDHVVVNGELLIEAGGITDARPGRVLRSGRDTRTPVLG